MPEPTQPGRARVWEKAEAERRRFRRTARREGMGGFSISGVVEMVADFLGLVEVVFYWVFCKKRWITRGKKCGNCGKWMVNGG
jgi:hypothetical protein